MAIYQKTRLYQIHISNNLEEIEEAGYHVKAYPDEESLPEQFIKGKKYIAFLVKRRN